MRANITACILFSAILQVSAGSFAQKITLHSQELTLKNFFREIKRQTGYNVAYSNQTLNDKDKIWVDFQNAPLEIALEKAFADRSLSFEISNRDITINRKMQFFPDNLLIRFQQLEIRGRIVDIENKGLPGATISVKGKNQSVTSLSNGDFVLRNVEEDAVLEISYVGFKAQQIAVNKRTTINIVLEEDASALNEVVVTGYTETKRTDLTGSIATVNISDLQKAPVRSFEEALAGRVTGVQVASQDGKPGSGINILIRGVGSISQSSAPLWVIDGLAIDNPDNDLLDPNNIESITVLKDASSTSIYGARGSNGVIVVTTKRGKAGEPKVNYSGYYGVNQPTKYMKLLNPYEFVKVISEQFGTAANPYLTGGTTLEDYRYTEGSDWQTQLLRTGSQQNHSISVSGGNTGTLYSLSGNALDQQGIIINSGYMRYQGKMTLDQNVSEKVKVGGSLTYTSGKITGLNPTATGDNSLFYHAYTYRPIPIPGIQVEDFEESLYDPSNGINDYRVNPVLSARNEIRNNISNNTIGNLYLDYRILKNLKLTVRGALNTNAIRVEAFNGSGTRSGGPNGTAKINGSVSDSKSQVYDNTNLLEYKATINNKHRITTLLGTAIQKVDYSIYGYSATNIPDESLGLSGLDAGIINSLPTGRRSSNSLVSGFGSVNYIYNNKYYLTATFRADGSSKFVGNNRWGYFPSAAIKWKLSEEKFFKKFRVLSDGNISFSYGETGNNRVGDFDTYATIQFQNPLSLNGSLQGNSAVITSLANPSLRWETTRSADLGFDFGFFDNHLTLALGLYHKHTNDLLYRTSLPTSTGYTSSIKNVASISNRGIEIALDVKVISKRDFDYTTNFNISFNRNRLEGLADPSEEAITSTVNWEFAYSSIPAYISKIGGPLGQIYGLVSDGLYQYSDFDRLPNGTFTLKPNIHSKGAGTTAERAATQPGDVKFVDINNDGQITAEDRTVLGNGYPLHIGGWSNNLRYKNFDLNIFFQWSYGNDIINANRLWFDQGLGIKERSSIFSGQNSFAAFANRWTSENQNTDIPRLNRAITGVYGSQFVEDGSYLRLKTLNLGYTLPSKWLTRYKVSKLRVYVSTNNIVTWSKYKGYDPEVSAFRTGLTPSLDYSTYPRPLTVTGGLNLTL